MGLTEKYAFRAEMVRRLHDDLIGPRGGDEHETIDESPLDRYIAGVLWPADSGTQDAVAEEPVDGAGEETGPTDLPVSQSRMRYPTSAGITFTVDAGIVDEVSIRVSAARYLPGDEVQAEADQRSRARDQHRSPGSGHRSGGAWSGRRRFRRCGGSPRCWRAGLRCR